LERQFDAKLAALERLMCVKIVALEKSTQDRLAELDRATTLAALTLRERLEGMNEFRAQLKDQAATFISRTELKAFEQIVEADLRSLRQARDEAKGKASQQAVNVSTVIAVLGLLMSAIALVSRFL
jgi:hypothetical protein